MSDPQKIIVIGAGINGVATAIWLRRAGHEVTLLDKDGPGAGASFGNAGLLAQWAIVPINTPGLMKTGLKYLLDPKSPLFLQWRHAPRLMPWLLRFVSNANEADARRMIEGLIPIVTDSLAQHQALTRGTSAADFIALSDVGFAYESRAGFEADRYGWNFRRAAGMAPALIEGPAVQEAEPILGPQIRCLAVSKDHGHILNPGGYLKALAQVLTEEGGTFRQAEVRDLSLTDGRITGVETDQGRLPCDHAVLAAGIWSKPLMRKLGLKVQIEAERGYHLHLRNPSQMPNNPLMVTTGKFGVTPMNGGLRCAGTVELGSTVNGPSRKPLALIRHYIAQTFPDLTYDSADEWLGFRPSTPDSLPLVGEIGKTGVYAAFGHQHIGLTAGAKTGRLVADMISGRRPNMDMTPYDANRFSR
ncbi:FAD-binding oxidoreductase [Roseovarius sp. CAU 1744]|uniref:NAD(P)/FAD-dependent oxidoreductase n=1 Tax=Roseovarius sp. CAU 1744 TaxID=3140368 RepID=UPI00325A8866